MVCLFVYNTRLVFHAKAWFIVNKVSFGCQLISLIFLMLCLFIPTIIVQTILFQTLYKLLEVLNKISKIELEEVNQTARLFIPCCAYGYWMAKTFSFLPAVKGVNRHFKRQFLYCWNGIIRHKFLYNSRSQFWMRKKVHVITAIFFMILLKAS